MVVDVGDSDAGSQISLDVESLLGDSKKLTGFGFLMEGRSTIACLLQIDSDVNGA
jgi:hypothetical protein